MASLSPRSVLLLGDLHAAEFGAVIALLRGAVSHRRLWECERFADLEARVAERSPRIELVVVCQGWSDQFSRSQVHSLLSSQPLARVVCCHGAWCESDGRTRDLWPLAVRLPVDEAARCIAEILADWAREDRAAPQGGPWPDESSLSPRVTPAEALLEAEDRTALPPAWGPAAHVSSREPRAEALGARLPLTASRAEIFAQRFPPLRSAHSGNWVIAEEADDGSRFPPADFASTLRNGSAASGRAGRVLVDSPDRPLREMLTCGLRSQGWESLASEREGPELVVFDADPWGPERRQRLGELLRSVPEAAVVWLTGSPWESREGLPCRPDRVLTWSKLAPLGAFTEACWRACHAGRTSTAKPLER